MVSTPLYPMVFMIIIPFLNGYFIGNMPHFQTYPNGGLRQIIYEWFQQTNKAMENGPCYYRWFTYYIRLQMVISIAMLVYSRVVSLFVPDCTMF